MLLSPSAFELLVSRVTWEERWLELEAVGAVDLPGYAGSTLRGALGTVMRPALCALGAAGCGEQCGSPGTCPFFSLFEQSRAGGGQGPNIPKPLILEAPLGEGLRAIALGAPVGGGGDGEYELIPGGGGTMPAIEARGRVALEPGTRLKVGLRALGAAAAALDGIVEGVRLSGGLEVKGGRLRLAGVEARRGGLRETMTIAVGTRPPQVLRLALVTPALIGGGGERGGTCFEAVALGRIIADQAVIRTVSLYNAFFRREREEKIPFVTPQWPGVAMTASRLFRYRLPRQSYRQGRWMDFDGVVGWMEWEGAGVGAMLPWLRAAEALHVGQKATFGLGRVELVE